MRDILSNKSGKDIFFRKMIRVDDREHAVIEQLKSRGAKFNVERLELGDFLISDFIIERKTKNDLTSSVTDGRYHEQKTRMMEIFAPEKIIYLIEFESGTLDDDDTKLNSIYNMMSRDKIRVFRTTGPAETSVFLMRFFESCAKLEAGALSTVTNLEAVTKSRGKTKTTESFYLGFLQSLPGISAKTATIIAAKYANFDAFIFAAKNNPGEIAEISLGKKRLGKATAAKIQQTLFSTLN